MTDDLGNSQRDNPIRVGSDPFRDEEEVSREEALDETGTLKPEYTSFRRQRSVGNVVVEPWRTIYRRWRGGGYVEY
jgi:hypothetical protein